jgi:hypothetical protein
MLNSHLNSIKVTLTFNEFKVKIGNLFLYLIAHMQHDAFEGSSFPKTSNQTNNNKNGNFNKNRNKNFK